jgi:predicted metal-dependent peptidase
MLIFGNKLTVDQRLEKATANILQNGDGKYDAVIGLLMYGEVTVDDATRTAATDGKNEWYGRAYCDKLTDPQLRFLRLHEVMHKMRRDMHVWRHLYSEDAELANKACDYVNNLTLVEADAGRGFIVIPEGGLLDIRFHGMSAGQVYALLKQEKQQQAAQQEQQEQQAQQQGAAEGNSDNVSKIPDEGKSGGVPQSEGFDYHDWEAAGKMSAEEVAEQAREIDDAIRQGAVYAGRTGSGGKRLVEDILAAQVSWEDALRDFLQNIVSGRDCSSWRRIHRRSIASGDYLPAGVSEEMGEIVLGIDTSGSISGVFLSQFLGEVVGICNALHPSRVRLLYWDTKVCREEVYETDNLDTLIRTTKPEGGGGTRPSCVTQYMEQESINPECVVMLTDGYVGSWGDDWKCPVLWCVLNNKSAEPTVGQAVHVSI